MATNLTDYVKQLGAQLQATAAELASIRKQVAVQQAENFDPLKEIHAIPGRRIAYFLTGNQSFTSTQNGVRGSAINMLVSQDGPFIMTHMPVVMWRVNLPANATNFGIWRPVYSWPLPAETETADILNISWEIQDSGSQRNFQNESLPPVFSFPHRLHELPIPTLFAPNTTVSFTPTYEDIAFDSGGTATTGGLLKVMLPGYRIVNM